MEEVYAVAHNLCENKMKKVDLDGNWFDGETLYSGLERAIETPKKKGRTSKGGSSRGRTSRHGITPQKTGDLFVIDLVYEKGKPHPCFRTHKIKENFINQESWLSLQISILGLTLGQMGTIHHGLARKAFNIPVLYVEGLHMELNSSTPPVMASRDEFVLQSLFTHWFRCH